MPEAVDAVIAAARDFMGERITTNATLREHHSHGQDTQPPVLPDAVAFIESTEEACRLMALCHAEHVPVDGGVASPDRARSRLPRLDPAGPARGDGGDLWASVSHRDSCEARDT